MRKRGFTLIELLIVIVIIGILAGIVVGIVGTNARRKANDTKKKADFHELQNALESYYSDHNAYPAGNYAAMTTALFPADVNNQYLKTDPATMVANSGNQAYTYSNQAGGGDSTGTDYRLDVRLEDTNASGPGVVTVNGEKHYQVTNKQ